MVILAGLPALAAEDCVECHRSQADEFAQTAMARAAATPSFLKEWADANSDRSCVACHSPSGSPGIGCPDCHGSDGHPYSAVAVPDACARCHDAPGESTVRMFKISLAARSGTTCLDCHLEAGRGPHAFRGPSDSSFLRNVATIHLVMGEGRLIVSMRHTAGHALPGGTTGRAVWLVLRGLDARGSQVWDERHRFGWLNDGRGWQDHTLAPDHGTIVEVEAPERNGAATVEARLLYGRQPATKPGSPSASFEELSRAIITLQ
ncbi:MAG: hypothetical protein EPN20_07920 [Magnetospirillum sp.]|nr:MAG: hypothetical protein EPN20_07920 [Magnetospirillum sp.]